MNAAVLKPNHTKQTTKFSFNKKLCFSTVCHVIFLIHHSNVLGGFAEIDLDKYVDAVIVNMKPFKFLTISGWCYVFQLHHVILSLLVEFQMWRGTSGDQIFIKKYEKMKDRLFRSLVFPSTVLVSSLFWLLFLLNRDLVYPDVWDAVIPNWMNHGVHTSTIVFSCIELVMQRGHCEDRKKEAVIYFSLSLGYSVLMNVVYLFSGVWFYPFLGMLSWYQLFTFQLLFSLSGWWLLQLTWRIDGVEALAQKKA